MRVLAHEQQGSNVLILRRLDHPVHGLFFTEAGRKFTRSRYELEYRWLSPSGGVHGNEFTYWTATEARHMTAAGLFNSVNLF